MNKNKDEPLKKSQVRSVHSKSMKDRKNRNIRVGLIALIFTSVIILLINPFMSDSKPNLDTVQKEITIATKVSNSSPRDFEKLILGTWEIERWHDPVEGMNTGTMTIETKVNDKTFRGEISIFAGSDGRLIRQDIKISALDNNKVELQGNVTDGKNWANDYFLLNINGNRLEGGGDDFNGNRQEVIFIKLR